MNRLVEGFIVLNFSLVCRHHRDSDGDFLTGGLASALAMNDGTLTGDFLTDGLVKALLTTVGTLTGPAGDKPSARACWPASLVAWPTAAVNAPLHAYSSKFFIYAPKKLTTESMQS